MANGNSTQQNIQTKKRQLSTRSVPNIHQIWGEIKPMERSQVENRINFTVQLPPLKTISLLIAALSIIGAVSAQSLTNEKCKVDDVVLQLYQGQTAAHEVVVSIPMYRLNRKVEHIDDLTNKEVKKIKRSARRLKSCRVYVDIEQLFVDRGLNPGYDDHHLTCLVTLQSR